MKHSYRWHRRLGWILAPLFALSALSGALLLWLQPLPTPPGTLPPPARWAHALDRGLAELARTQPGAQADLVDLPRRAGQPIRVHLAAPGLWAELDADSGALLSMQTDRRDVRARVLDLHEHLLQADVGPWVLRAAAFAGLVLIAMGLRIWWRVRALPARSPWRRWHRFVGVAVVLPLAGMLASGFVLRWPELARAALSAWSAELPPSPPPQLAQARGTTPATLGESLQAATRALPGAQPMRLYAGDGGIVRVRLRSDEWHPNGLNNVYLRADDATVLRTTTWRELPLAARYLNVVYPLHTGWLPGPAGVAAAVAVRVLWTLFALALLWMALSGSVQRWRANAAAARRG